MIHVFKYFPLPKLKNSNFWPDSKIVLIGNSLDTGLPSWIAKNK